MEFLVPSHLKAIQEIDNCFTKLGNIVICVCGKKGSGKKKVAREYISRFEGNTLTLTIDDFMMPDVDSCFALSSKMDSLLSNINNSDIVYIDSFENMLSITSNFRFKMAPLSYVIWSRFIKKIKVKTLITCSKINARDMISDSVWLTEIKLNEEDRKYILNLLIDSHVKEETINVVDRALSCVRETNLNSIRKAITYANRLYTDDWLKEFKRVLMLMDSDCLDIPDRIVKPIYELDMVGLEPIMETIKREVMEPLKDMNPLIPICKGLLLHGPPGSGKSTIGRWISHELGGRVYMAESCSNQSLIGSFVKKFRLACDNAPSVVFLDDFESILDNPDSVRELYVSLDGISGNGRQNVCVIATCMNISAVPEALIRGGRFERCIEFKKPPLEVIKSIIENRFRKVVDSSTDLGLYLRSKLSDSDYSVMSRQVINWTPSNIHLVIDSVLRSISYCLLRNEQIDPVSSFTQEAVKIDSHIKRSIRVISNETISDTTYYT